ncbi:MAG TPA: Gfo/Idh/MocA family oxidoreductase [Bryobacteraceae bacterium]|nr:Gfo/Idh/MocA family oxidoreductase [Bryobacteraceae bacterium]
MNRRHFLMSTAAAAGTAAMKGAPSINDTVRVACVGIRGQGNSHIREYSAMPNVEIAALCDVDENVLNKRLDEVVRSGKKKPAAFTDVRKLLEDKSIDAISIATPNHWHSLIGIWACQAGKDVYCEKPCSHNIFEGRQLVAAAQKYNRIVQHGTNSRSGVAIREAMDKMREGLIGDVYMARGLCFKWRDTIGHTPEEPVPAGVHYDLWTGPAPLHAFTKNRFHYNWHWNWDYGNGDIGNQGIHEMDVARWGLGVKYPTKVSGMGGHFMFDDDQQTPNTMVSTFEFDEGGKKKFLVFEVRHWMSNHEAGIGEERKAKNPNTVGNLFYGSKGYLAIDGYGQYKTWMGKDQQPGPSRSEDGNNWANFIEAVRSRRQSDLNAPIEEGYRSTVLVHLANISYRLGRTLEFDAENLKCKGDPEATAMFTRKYRAPFVVPEKV